MLVPAAGKLTDSPMALPFLVKLNRQASMNSKEPE